MTSPILNTLPIHESWAPIIKSSLTKHEKDIKKIETLMQENKVFPYPENIFNAFNMTPLNKVKIVITGQDPYFNLVTTKDGNIPQAMGLSFSVNKSVTPPPSLKNMYDNLKRFGHINNIPKDGDLTKWASQGCLLLNTSLTVNSGMPNSHETHWRKFTDDIIKYISDNCDNVVFFLWGGPSLKKLSLIDQTKHKISISSHPSPLSVKSKLKTYESFYNTDHFGIANEYLTSVNKEKIDWNL